MKREEKEAEVENTKQPWKFAPKTASNLAKRWNRVPRALRYIIFQLQET